jgi:hypothetical protein
MSKIEDYPGPTKDQPEKEEVEFPADAAAPKENGVSFRPTPSVR